METRRAHKRDTTELKKMKIEGFKTGQLTCKKTQEAQALQFGCMTGGGTQSSQKPDGSR